MQPGGKVKFSKSDEQASQSGWMKKRLTSKEWKWHWFVLSLGETSNTLKYYKSKKNAEVNFLANELHALTYW